MENSYWKKIAKCTSILKKQHAEQRSTSTTRDTEKTTRDTEKTSCCSNTQPIENSNNITTANSKKNIKEILKSFPFLIKKFFGTMLGHCSTLRNPKTNPDTNRFCCPVQSLSYEPIIKVSRNADFTRIETISLKICN